MFHEPAATEQHDPATAYKTRLGVWMFVAYALIYVGFVAVNLAVPELMEAAVLAGLNTPIVYGFGLIVLALIQAVVYNAMCLRMERKLAAAEPGQGK